MINFIEHLSFIEESIWSWLSIPMILFLGLFLTIKTRAIQIRRLGFVAKTFYSLLTDSNHGKGVHPIRAFFASVGGCVGVGNVVAICTAVQVGGPGALFWIWVTAILGMIIKYSEVYLGVRFRVATATGYSGGPHYFLQKVFKTSSIPILAATLLSIYGVEIYQFNVVTTHLAHTFELNHLTVVLGFLMLVLWACLGGVDRVGRLSSWIIPLFVVIYIGMSWVVFYQERVQLLEMIKDVFHYAFTPHGLLGGTFGSAMLLTISHGMRRGCYTGDVGVGYASVIQSETSLHQPEVQASLAFVDIFLDTFIICTTSVFLVLITGVWQSPMEPSLLVQTALSHYFPYMPYFVSFFLFLLGYSTINAYFVSGLKCAQYLFPNWGRVLYTVLGAVAFIVFSFYGTQVAQSIMTIVGGLLLVINGIGIFMLRNEIRFEFLEGRGSTVAEAKDSLTSP